MKSIRKKANGKSTSVASGLEPASADPRYVLRLYVAGLNRRSTLAVERIKAICERQLPGRYDLTVIDLYRTPQLARQAQVIAAPTLVKESPPPLRQLIGDMANKNRVLRGLDLYCG
jgi:circadian clock protein KaiB